LGIDSASDIQGANILLVEDNEVNQQVACELLEQAQIVVTIANNGEEAIDAVNKELFDGILMDIQMPIMDGYQATKIIRGIPQYKTVPIIAMTANAMVEDYQRCLASGMNEHIAKPIDVKTMFATLAKWIKPSNQKPPSKNLIPQALDEDTTALPVLPGIDVNSGIARVSGNIKSYIRLLDKFAINQQHDITEIEQAIADHDQTTAVRIAHTLKGTAGSIGAKKLQKVAAQLETALTNEKSSNYLPLLKVTSKELNSILSVIQERNHQQEKVVENHPAFDFSILEKKLNVLLHSLEEYNSESEVLLEEIINKTSDPMVKTALEAIMKQVIEYDFETAAIDLKALIAKTKISI